MLYNNDINYYISFHPQYNPWKLLLLQSSSRIGSLGDPPILFHGDCTGMFLSFFSNEATWPVTHIRGCMPVNLLNSVFFQMISARAIFILSILITFHHYFLCLSRPMINRGTLKYPQLMVQECSLWPWSNFCISSQRVSFWIPHKGPNNSQIIIFSCC